MKFREFTKKYARIIVIGIIGIINASILYLPASSFISKIINISLLTFVLALIYTIVEAWEKLTEKNEIVTANIAGWQQPAQDINSIKQDVAAVRSEIVEKKEENEEEKEKNRIIIDLINNNIISAQTLEKNIIDKKFISVLCYQAGFSVRNGIISQKLRDKIDHLIKQKKDLVEEGIDINREYPKIFEEMGFTKLANHNGFFIIPEDNLPSRLHDLKKLSDYFMKRGFIVVDEEWKKIKNLHERFDKEFYEAIKNKANPVNFNILIMRVNRRDMRHRFILRDDFNREFSNELSAIVRLNNFKTSHSEKIAIKNIISQSSLKILILSLTPSEQEKILQLEDFFKMSESEGGLGIINFYDYYTKNLNDIKNIFRKKFKKEEKINQYAELIFKNSKDYKEDLNKLGIKF